MKIVSSFIDDINIEKGKYHAFTFESSYLLKLFKIHLFTFFNNKAQSETQFINVLDSNNNPLKPKDFHFISFDCHHLDLTIEKNTKAEIHKLLFHQLENNPNMVESFLQFQNQLTTFTSGLELIDEDLLIEFQLNEKALLNLIKSLDIIIEYKDDDYIPNYRIRDFLLKSMLKMNPTNKEPIMVISHPETDIGRNEFDYVIEQLKKLNVTTIVISSQENFLTAANDEHLFLINKYGNKYDIINLRKELEIFNLIKKESAKELARSIALFDFNKNYQLLNEEIKNFLMSDRL